MGGLSCSACRGPAGTTYSALPATSAQVWELTWRAHRLEAAAVCHRGRVYDGTPKAKSADLLEVPSAIGVGVYL